MSHTSLYMHKEVFIMPKPKTVKKVRAIAGILYTDSAPADWQDRIANLHMMALVSPLHDSDVQADGSPKNRITMSCLSLMGLWRLTEPLNCYRISVA